MKVRDEGGKPPVLNNPAASPEDSPRHLGFSSILEAYSEGRCQARPTKKKQGKTEGWAERKGERRKGSSS